MAYNFSQPLDSETLAAYLAEAALTAPAAGPALTRLVARYSANATSNRQIKLPSGLEPDEAAHIIAALSAVLHTSPAPLTAVTFQPENIRILQSFGGWRVALVSPGNAAIPALDPEAAQAAFAGLLYRLVTGQEFAEDPSGQKSQLNRLREKNLYLTAVLEDALVGRFDSLTALAGGFGWSLYRKDHLNAVPAALPRQTTRQTASSRILQLPASLAEQPLYNRAWGGPLALVSLGVAMVLLATTILFSVNGLNKEYSQQGEAALTPGKTQPTGSNATPVVALQISRQADGANLTRYNPAFDQVAEKYTDPTQLTTGAAIPLSDFRSLQVQDAHWSPDGKQVGLALKDGGWENWDIAARQRVTRKELPNTDQYQFISWSPDGQNFAGLGLDGQLRLGKGDRILKTVSFSNGQTLSRKTTGSDWPFIWSPDSSYLLLNLSNISLQLWNFQNLPVQVEPARDASGKNNVVPVLGAVTGGAFNGFAWSPDGKTIARVLPGSNEQQVAIYSLNNLVRQYIIKIPNTPLTARDGKTQINSYADYNGGNAKLDWSPDGRYMALVRSVTPTDLTKITAIQNIAQLTVLEVPVQPGSSGTSSSAAVPLDASPTVTPPTFETWPFQPLTTPYRPQDQVLSWSGDNRLAITGLTTYTGQALDDEMLPPNQAMTLELKPAENKLQWLPNGPFMLPFQDKPDYAAWAPDNKHILFNSDYSGLGISSLPGQAGADLPTSLLHKETTSGYSLYLPSPDGHNFLVYQNSGNPQVRDSATGKLLAELAKPSTQQSTIGQPTWSQDGKYLAIPYLVPVSQLNETLINEETIRAWKFEPGQPPTLAGDLLVPGSSDNYQNSSLEWDTQASKQNGQSTLLFNFGVNGIGRWDVTKPLPSLNYQRFESNQQTAASVVTNNASPYFEVAGRLSLWNTGGKQVWFPDHKHLVSYSNGLIFIQDLIAPDANFDLDKEKGIPLIPQPPVDANQGSPNMMVSPDGRVIAVGLSNGLLTLYDAQTGKLFNSFTAHVSTILGLNFSPDGRYLATSSTDRLVKIWDTTSWRSLAVLRLTGADAGNVTWLPDNKTLAVTSGYQDGTLLWRALA